MNACTRCGSNNVRMPAMDNAGHEHGDMGYCLACCETVLVRRVDFPAVMQGATVSRENRGQGASPRGLESRHNDRPRPVGPIHGGAAFSRGSRCLNVTQKPGASRAIQLHVGAT